MAAHHCCVHLLGTWLVRVVRVMCVVLSLSVLVAAASTSDILNQPACTDAEDRMTICKLYCPVFDAPFICNLKIPFSRVGVSDFGCLH